MRKTPQWTLQLRHNAPLLILFLTSPTAFAAPNFARDIAPLIYQNCAACHHPGESAPFSLLTYDDVRKHARQIALVTKNRIMPPWLPESGYGDFADATRLTDIQIRQIADWVSAGMPPGDLTQAPPAPQFKDAWQLGAPDLILKASRPVTIPPTGPNVFWNFVFSPNVPSTRFIRAVEIRPGDKRLVHHANLIVDRLQSGRKLEKTPGAGFPGMDLDIKSTVFDPPGHFLFWKPGSAPYSEPDGFSWRLEPGNDLVLNTHLQPSGKPEVIQPSIGLYFTDKPPTQFPVLVQLEHDGALDIPAGARDFVISDDFRLPLDADVLAVYPHAHYLGTLMEGYATLPDGKRVWLIRIPSWDLNRQAVFRYRTPVFLPKDSVVSMRFHYDNSAANPRNPHNPPLRVKAGNDANDEMGHLWLQLLPRGPGDRRRELAAAALEHKVEKYPDDYSSWLNLGELRLSRLDIQGSVSALESAVRADPSQSQGHNILGAALTRVGRSREALDQFKRAIELDPDNVNARYNLVFALAKAGDTDNAEQNLRKVITAYPKEAALHNLMGELLARKGDRAGAAAEFDRALALDPKLQSARENRDQLRSMK